MKKARNVIVCAIVAVSLLFALPIAAGPAEDFREARLLYLMLMASFAAYPGGDGDIVMTALERDGWKTVPYIQKNETSQAKFFFLKKEYPSSPAEYLLAISGTSTRKDIEMDFKTGKVFFAGRTFDEFEENAEKKQETPDQVPMVHKGFHQYIQAVFSAETRESDGGKPGRKIVDLLLENPESPVYLTGHSSGGGAAILLGARLISMGVKPGQLKIATYGAPPVGNAEFARKYAPDLDIVRVVVAGDPIPGLLKIFARGYQQFGREIRWTTSGYTFDEKHYPNIYMDCALRNLYDKRLAASRAGDPEAAVSGETPSIDGKRIYIAVINNHLSKDMDGEFSYMREVLLDEYRNTLSAYVIGEFGSKAPLHFEALRTKASEADCDRMVIVNIWGSKQTDPAVYHGGLMSKPDEVYDLIVIEQAVFRVSDGTLLDGRTYQNGSKYFTPLGALASAAVALGRESAVWSGQ